MMEAIGGLILICVGIGLIWYGFKRYKEDYGAEKSWLKIIMFVIDVVGEGLAALGLLLILVGLIMVM